LVLTCALLGVAAPVAGVALCVPSVLLAQGVTTSSMAGRVTREGGAGVEGARVSVVHVPSGTQYAAVTRADGRYTIPNMRVGGPYRATVLAIGLERQVRDGLFLNLGVATDASFALSQATTRLQAVSVVEQSGAISSTRTGAATAVTRDVIETLPTISRSINDFTRLTPQASGTSFAGQDTRLNNITVDGSYFNNSFGLQGQPGGRTGVAPIPLDAIEQVQVNIAPFDVRQGNFVGAGVNAVTKSGTNEFEGSVYYLGRDQDLVGTRAYGAPVNPGTFRFGQFGARLGGPIVRNRLFFFVNFEQDEQTQPATVLEARANGTQAITGNTTRVLASDLTGLTQFLEERFGYATGPYAGYNNETPSDRLITKLDWNVTSRHKASLRYIQLNSSTDVLASNSNSLGFGNRYNLPNALSFQNSNYAIGENIRSLVGEVNSQLGSRVSNSLIVGYTKNDESRVPRGSFFPMVDVLSNNATYTSFGYEAFTPNNELRYNTAQLQNNLTVFAGRHDLTFGISAQQYRSENVFFPGAQSVYVYNSLSDFYTDANDFLANPNRTTSPVTLRRFQVRYNNVPGAAKPTQNLQVLYAGAYAQDEWRATDRLRLTLGARVDVPKFENTALRNPAAEQLTFRDETGEALRVRTDRLPRANPLFSPRFGLNWDVRGDRSTQVRGGTGVFTGSPAYVWISNQIGNNGMLTGFEQLDSTTVRPFNPNPDRYKPTTVTGAPASSYELAVTDPDYRFPQIWRTNLAVDQRLPWGVVATVEGLYGRDVNGTYYIDANLSAPEGAFSGPDARPRWTVDDCPTVNGVQQRLNCNVPNAIVLKNQSVGRSWNVAGSLEKAFAGGFYAKAAYSYGESKNTVDPGSIAAGSWTGNAIVRDPNNPGLGFSANSPGHRAFLALSYRRQYFGFGATGVSLFVESRNNGNVSYTYSGDLNGDGVNNNDLLYVPKDAAEMNFQQYTLTTNGVVTRTFTVAEQQAAFEQYLQKDPYLRERRGQYAARNAFFLPMVTRADLSVTQDVFRNFLGKRNALQLRADILNVGNLLNDRWGVQQRLVTTQPLVAAGASSDGRARYRLQNFGGTLVTTPFQRGTSLTDVYRIQLGARYTFN
jgi:outer membrane receptor protein involved in Fe transport